MIICITGPRYNPDRTIHTPTSLEMSRFWHLYDYLGGTSIVHGAARGTDTYVSGVARILGIPLDPYPVDTDLDGTYPEAPHHRNRRMLISSQAEALVGFGGGGRGTRGCLKIGCEMKLNVFRWDEELEDFRIICGDIKYPLRREVTQPTCR